MDTENFLKILDDPEVKKKIVSILIDDVRSSEIPCVSWRTNLGECYPPQSDEGISISLE
jgi:hypothetical protein